VFSRIVVAVDGGELSDLALGTALRLAKDQHAKVRVVHVADVLPPAGLGAEYMDYELYQSSVRKAAQDVVTAAMAKAREAGAEAEPVVVETVTHDAGDGVVAEGERWGADLIVMGTHGRTGLGKLLLGSVAEEVVRHASCPVLLVRLAAKLAHA